MKSQVTAVCQQHFIRNIASDRDLYVKSLVTDVCQYHYSFHCNLIKFVRFSEVLWTFKLNSAGCLHRIACQKPRYVFVRVTHQTWTGQFGTFANSADLDQTPQNNASDQGLHSLLRLQEVKG